MAQSRGTGELPVAKLSENAGKHVGFPRGEIAILPMAKAPSQGTIREHKSLQRIESGSNAMWDHHLTSRITA